MNFITFGFTEKGSPIFLNQEPYQQVGTMYLMKTGDNSIIGITLDDKAVKLVKALGKARGRKAKTEAAASAAEPKRHGRKPKAESVEAAPKKKIKKAGKPKAKKEKVAKEVTAGVKEIA